jgi:hypothetical protein
VQYGWLPLHCAVAAPHASLEVVGWLIQKYPAAAKMKDQAGWTPVHLAVDVKTPQVAIVEALLQYSPEPALIQEKVRRFSGLPCPVCVHRKKSSHSLSNSLEGHRCTLRSTATLWTRKSCMPS